MLTLLHAPGDITQQLNGPPDDAYSGHAKNCVLLRLSLHCPFAGLLHFHTTSIPMDSALSAKPSHFSYRATSSSSNSFLCCTSDCRNSLSVRRSSSARAVSSWSRFCSKLRMDFSTRRYSLRTSLRSLCIAAPSSPSSLLTLRPEPSTAPGLPEPTATSPPPARDNSRPFFHLQYSQSPT